MRILIDAMGGDHAPEAIVRGAIDAAAEFDVQIVLVGRGEAILKSLSTLGLDTLPKGVEVANADDVVDMCDDPATVIRTRPDSSMVVGLRMLAEGAGDAFISAGSTGALLSAATLIVKRVKGIRRAALCPEIPTKSGSTLLIDCGANAECTPEFLTQFAVLGSIYAQKVQGKTQPRVGLLNIGTEESKGGALQKETFSMLRQADALGVGQRGGPGCVPGHRGCGGGRRLLRQRAAEDHRRHSLLYVRDAQGAVYAQYAHQAGGGDLPQRDPGL